MKQKAKKQPIPEPSLALENERKLNRLSERIDRIRQLLKMID